jgi:DNA-binding response OmpR family regulator
MPVMDVVEATRRIRQMGGALATVPIIALSASVLPDELERCRAAGMDDHLAKPVDRRTLLSMVARWAGQAEPKMGTVVAVSEEVRVIDDEVLTENELLIGRDQMTAMAQAFEKGLGERVAAMAAGRDNLDLVAGHAHELVSHAGNFGLGELCGCSRAVEAACRRGDRAEVELLLTRLAEASDRAREQLTLRFPPQAAA